MTPSTAASRQPAPPVRPTGHPDHGTSPAQRVVGAGLAALGGLAIAVQGRINGQLGASLHDGMVAALISFGVGLVLLLATVPTTAAGRRGLARLLAALRAGRLRWWQCLGGMCGAYLVTTQGLTVSLLGVAVFTVAVVGGQVISSLAVDRAGFGPAGPQPLTRPRVIGAVLGLVAVVVAVSDEFGHPDQLWWAALPALAGLGLAWQQAVNGRVRVASDHTMVATLVNFTTGTAALLLVCAVDVLVRGWPTSAPQQWWLYVGGTLGIVAIGTAVVAVRLIGVLLLGLTSVAGQLLGAVLLDLVAPTDGGRISAAGVAGTVVTLIAAAVAALPSRRRRSASRGASA
ncbi:DMT family transporter [Goodfellowiella coeruleoviolacea]|uniref:DMT family transporter n=1 Tax=Goodfellowiella coeruleoviolacea TaxID=334858 RepID=UPI0020A27D21|nr:DMT family transporter [Goodfellowiella coeruleoviolacea]